MPTPRFVIGTQPETSDILRALRGFGAGVVEQLERRGVRIFVLRPGQKYADVSPALRDTGYTEDDDQHANGVYVLPERRVYLATTHSEVVRHETAHAIDHVLGLALGRNDFLSRTEPALAAHFDDLRSLRSPYKAVTAQALASTEELVAEALRAIAGPPIDAWFGVPVTAELLAQRDPWLYALLDGYLAQLRRPVAA